MNLKIAVDLGKRSRHAEANPQQAICCLSNLESRLCGANLWRETVIGRTRISSLVCER
jgi:hypothetical protein